MRQQPAVSGGTVQPFAVLIASPGRAPAFLHLCQTASGVGTGGVFAMERVCNEKREIGYAHDIGFKPYVRTLGSRGQPTKQSEQ